MAPTDQQILDQAKQTLLDILAGRVAEFRDNQQARLLEIDRLETLIARYESRTDDDTRQILKPLRTGDF